MSFKETKLRFQQMISKRFVISRSMLIIVMLTAVGVYLGFNERFSVAYSMVFAGIWIVILRFRGLL